MNLLGLRTFGDIIEIPEQALKIRCEKDFIQFLENVLGKRKEIFIDYRPPNIFSDQYSFGYDVKNKNELNHAIEYLLTSFCDFLSNIQARANKIAWLFHSNDRKIKELLVHSSLDCRNFKIWHQLTLLKIENQFFGTAIDKLSIKCENLIVDNSRNIDFFDPSENQNPKEHLLDRLHTRLNPKDIKRLGCRDEHIPEYAVYAENNDFESSFNTKNKLRNRPFWLLPKPQPLKTLRKKLYWKDELSLISGPERIEDRWWSKPISRDYYTARNKFGNHYWIFCNRKTRRWYIQGIFS